MIMQKQICTRCKVSKRLNDFYSDRSRANGRGYVCKVCKRNNTTYNARANEKRRRRYKDDPKFREQVKINAQEWRIRPENARRRTLKQYGWTLAVYNRVRFADQKNLCAVCKVVLVDDKKSLAYAVIDHNHTTGKVRAVLCHGCNSAIGLMRESPKFLEAAARYLEKHMKEHLLMEELNAVGDQLIDELKNHERAGLDAIGEDLV